MTISADCSSMGTSTAAEAAEEVRSSRTNAAEIRKLELEEFDSRCRYSSPDNRHLRAMLPRARIKSSALVRAKRTSACKGFSSKLPAGRNERGARGRSANPGIRVAEYRKSRQQRQGKSLASGHPLC